MAFSLAIPVSQLNDLKRLKDIPSDSLDGILSQISQIERPLLRSGELLGVFKQFISEDISKILARQIVSLYGLKRQSGLSADDLASGLTAGLRDLSSARRWSSDDLAMWKKFEPKLAKLLSYDFLGTIEKSLNLSFEYANLLQTTRLLTDIRPVFTDDKQNIYGCVVSYTLSLTYDSADTVHKMELALDENDIKDLIKRCEEALKKGATAKRIMEAAGHRTIVAGTDNDAG